VSVSILPVTVHTIVSGILRRDSLGPHQTSHTRGCAAVKLSAGPVRRAEPPGVAGQCLSRRSPYTQSCHRILHIGSTVLHQTLTQSAGRIRSAEWVSCLDVSGYYPSHTP
jgi:hypothetical protein